MRLFLGSKTYGKSHSCLPGIFLPFSPHKSHVFPFLEAYFLLFSSEVYSLVSSWVGVDRRCSFLLLLFFPIFIYLFIWLSQFLVWLAGSLVVACKLLVVACMWDLVPRPGIKPWPPALGVRSLNHCATREVPGGLLPPTPLLFPSSFLFFVKFCNFELTAILFPGFCWAAEKSNARLIPILCKVTSFLSGGF